MKNLILPLLLILTLILSCRSESDEVLEKKNVLYNVYVAGSYDNKACYWENSIINYLTAGDNIKAEKIIVENNNVYVFGQQLNLGTSDYYFWKNNVKYNLYSYLGVPTNNNPLVSVLDIKGFHVKNNDVYLIGSVRGPLTMISGVYLYTTEHCYWKNGIKHVLFTYTGFHTGGYLKDITVHNNDVYVAATRFSTSTNWELGYFKNGNYSSVNSGECLGINSNANGVFMSIIEQNNSYYKNLLDNTNHFATLGGYKEKVILDTNDIYSFYNEVYYKNGTAIPINNPSGYNDIVDLKVVNDNKYMICRWGEQTTSLNIAYKVFINGVETQQITHTANNIDLGGSFNSIFVVQN